MTLKSGYLLGGMQLAAGHVGQQSLLLIRNIIVARLLPPEQFGIALTFLTIISAFDALSEFGLHLYLIRASNSNDKLIQQTMHSILFFRGTISALMIFVAATPIAILFQVPDAAWAYQLLALVPFLKGLQHLDLKRFQRKLRFLPIIIANSLATVVGTIVVIVATYVTRNYGAIVLGYIAQTATFVICSQLLADEKYRLGYSHHHARSMLKYGGPLALNGIVLFLSSQGDRVLIGAILGVKELAQYGVVSVLTNGATLFAIKLTGSLSFPILSLSEPGSKTYLRRFRVCIAISAVCAFSIMAFFAVAGQNVTTALFGETYDTIPLLATWLGIQAGFKLLRATQQNSMLAAANTKSVLISSLTSSSGIILAIVLTTAGFGVGSVAICMAGGELFSAAFGVSDASNSTGQLKLVNMKYVGCLSLAAGLFVVAHGIGLVPVDSFSQLLVAFILSVAWFAIVMILEQSFRDAVLDVAKRYIPI